MLWLEWAKKEFCLDPKLKESFSKMRGCDMVALGSEGFLAIAPPFTGDILWEHLEILQKGLYYFSFVIDIFRQFQMCVVYICSINSIYATN